MAALAVLAFAACGGRPGGDAAETGGPAGGTPSRHAPAVVTEEQSGETLRLRVGGRVALRLTSEIPWEGAAVGGAAVMLAPVEYLQDPGFREWEARAVQAGTATVRATADGHEPFEVVFDVRG